MNAPWTYFLSPAGPDRSVSLAGPGDRRGGDQGADQPYHLCGQGRRRRQAGMDEPVRDGGAGDVGDQLPGPLHRHVLEDHQVNGQGTQPRPDRQSRIRHARRARRDMRPAASAPYLVQVVLDPLRRHRRGLLLLIRPGDAQVNGICQIAAARTRARGEMVLGPVRDLPGHRRARAARLLPPRVPCPFRGTPLLPGRLPPGQVIRARRHRGVPAVPRPCPLRSGQPLPQVPDQRLQRRDPLRQRRDHLRLLPDQRVTRIRGRLFRRRHTSHSPQSSRKPPPVTAAYAET